MGVKIQFMTDEQDFEQLVGITISIAEPTIRSILGVPTTATMSLNGSTNFTSTYVLKDADVVSFHKEAGVKGF